MFKTDDTVFYGVHGVCRITGIVTKDFLGSTADYYVLIPVFENRSTVFVPVDKPELVKKMRPLLSKDEIEEVIRSMPLCEEIWIEDEPTRKEVYAELLKSGDRIRLISLIKTLRNRKLSLGGKNRKMHACDERFLDDALKMLHDEIAYVLEIERSQVASYITETIGAEKM